MGMSMRKYVRSWEYHKQQNTQTNVLSSHQCADNFFFIWSHITLSNTFHRPAKSFFKIRNEKKEVKFSLCRIARLLKKLPAHWWDVNWQHICLCFLLLTILRCWRNMKKWESMEMGLVLESMSEVEVEKVWESMRKYVRSWGCGWESINIKMGMRKYVRSWESMRKHEKVCQKLGLWLRKY